MRSLLLVLNAVLACLGSVTAFCPSATTSNQLLTRSAAATMKLYAGKPKFDKTTNKWEPAKDDDGIYPYDAVGSLLRYGPTPFLKRLTDAEGYEQDVLEYMALAGVSRAEATGNMDAKLFNAMDWAYQKTAENRGKPKVDLTYLDKKRAALTVIWAFVGTPFVFKVLFDIFSKYI